jgi:predicted ArsR family transcriptional regulator
MPRKRQFMNDDVIEFLKEHPRPFATAPEIADAMGVNNSAIHKRLGEMEAHETVKSMKVGASAKVFWLPERDISLSDC